MGWTYSRTFIGAQPRTTCYGHCNLRMTWHVRRCTGTSSMSTTSLIFRHGGSIHIATAFRDLKGELLELTLEQMLRPTDQRPQLKIPETWIPALLWSPRAAGRPKRRTSKPVSRQPEPPTPAVPPSIPVLLLPAPSEPEQRTLGKP